MLYNIISLLFHIFGAKVGIFFDIDKFICFFLQNFINPCVFHFFLYLCAQIRIIWLNC